MPDATSTAIRIDPQASQAAQLAFTYYLHSSTNFVPIVLPRRLFSALVVGAPAATSVLGMLLAASILANRVADAGLSRALAILAAIVAGGLVTIVVLLVTSLGIQGLRDE